MSERGAIARPTTEGGWWGRYHHHDTHPPRLGRALWWLYHHTFGQDHAEMARALIDEHPAGWSDLVQPAPGPFERAAFDRAGYRSPNDPGWGQAPACYCHGDRSENEQMLMCQCPVENAACDPWQIEWAYVLLTGGMFVLTSWHPERDRHLSAHRAVALVQWHRPEPHWREIEDRGRRTDFHTLAL